MVCAKTAPLDLLTQQKLAAPEPAASEPSGWAEGGGLGEAADNSGEVGETGLRWAHTGGRKDRPRGHGFRIAEADM